MRKALRSSLCLYQDIVDLMMMMYKLKGAEIMVNNEEIAEEIQEAIDKMNIARNNIYEASQILHQIKE